MAACKLHGNIQHKDGCSHRGTNFRARKSNEEHRGNSPYLFFRETIDIDKQAAAFPTIHLVVIANVPPSPLHVPGSAHQQSEHFRPPAETLTVCQDSHISFDAVLVS